MYMNIYGIVFFRTINFTIFHFPNGMNQILNPAGLCYKPLLGKYLSFKMCCTDCLNVKKLDQTDLCIIPDNSPPKAEFPPCWGCLCCCSGCCCCGCGCCAAPGCSCAEVRLRIKTETVTASCIRLYRNSLILKNKVFVLT